MMNNIPGPAQGGLILISDWSIILMLTPDWLGPDTWEEQSGKLATLTCLLVQLTNDTMEKIVLVSLSTR